MSIGGLICKQHQNNLYKLVEDYDDPNDNTFIVDDEDSNEEFDLKAAVEDDQKEVNVIVLKCLTKHSLLCGQYRNFDVNNVTQQGQMFDVQQRSL